MHVMTFIHSFSRRRPARTAFAPVVAALWLMLAAVAVHSAAALAFSPLGQPTAAVAAPAGGGTPNVVISQVFGGGSATGAFERDFIELFNAGDAPQDLTGWSVQSTLTGTSTTWRVTQLTGVTLQPGQYYLVQEGGSGSGTPLPTPDVVGGHNVPAAQGKVALVSDPAALSGACPLDHPNLVGLVGFGSNANCFEGAGTTMPNLSQSTAAVRKYGGCLRLGDNSADFAVLSPTPRNSASPLQPCSEQEVLSIAAIGGGLQPAALGQAFAEPLRVRVVDAVGNPVENAEVTFEVPDSGASAVLSDYTVHTDGNGEASTNATANSEFGHYTVIARAGAEGVASFDLFNGIEPGVPVVISQVFGGGGAVDRPFGWDFIELFNPSGVAYDLTGWSVQSQFTSASGGTDWRVTPLTDVVLQPGQYYLIQEGGGSADGPPLPTPDAIGSHDLTSFPAVALVATTQPLDVVCPPSSSPAVIDYVAIPAAGGNPTVCYLGTGPTMVIDNDTVVMRKELGCFNSRDNSADFEQWPPVPRNTASPFHICGDATVTLSHSASMDIAMGNPFEGFGIPDFNFLRTFSLDDFDISGNFEISSVTFGLHSSPGPTVVEVRIYALLGDNLVYSNMPLIASVETTVPAAGSLHTVPISAVVPAGTVFVVELHGLLDGISPGFNEAGETAPSYLASPTSGIGLDEPEDFLLYGAVAHLVMAVEGLEVESLSVSILGGTPQATQVGNPFEQPLEVRLTDADGDPMEAVDVVFTAYPGSTLSTTTVQTDSNGEASLSTSANGFVGPHRVAATAAGGYAAFELMNTPSFESSIVVSQIYGAGGGGGQGGISGPFSHDYIELFNRGSTAESLNGWSLQNAPGTGATWSVAELPDIVIQPGQYYLIQLHSFGNGGSPFPVVPDLVVDSSTFNVSAIFGKVALVADTAPRTGACPDSSGIADFVGYGSADPLCAWGERAPQPGIDALMRKGNGCDNKYNNDADFVVVQPLPRNSASGFVSCGEIENLTLTAIGGTPQATRVHQAFAEPLVVRVSDSGGDPVEGVEITLSVPLSGATAILSANTIITDGNGEASVVATASGVQGSFSVIASSSVGSPVAFQLTILPSEKEKVVISQVFGGGSATGAFERDFIELFNAGDAPQDLTGWSVQSTLTATSANWRVTELTDVVLQPGQYYLIQEGGSDSGTPLPTPDVVGGHSLPSQAGKVALVRHTTALSDVCPLDDLQVVSLVGYGLLAGSNCFEGSGPVLPNLSTSTAALRKYGGCLHTQDNTADFAVLAPTPRNSASVQQPCSEVEVLSISAIGGTPQVAAVLQPFANPLVVRVADIAGNPVEGVQVNFTVPDSGASAVLSADTVHTDSDGEASVTITANGERGNYTVVVEAGAEGEAFFYLFNGVEPGIHVVISQVFGGGTAAAPMGDFIELFNAGDTPQDLSGWSVQNAASLSNWAVTPLTDFVLQPGQYYLIQENVGTNQLPIVPDVIGTSNVSSNNGKVALVASTQALGVVCPFGVRPDAISVVGFGTSQACFEGSGPTAPTASGSEGTAAVRKEFGCAVTYDNSADFDVLPPSPRNSASGFVSCGEIENLTLTAVGGTPQATRVHQPFPEPLTVRLTDDDGEPVPDVEITFSAPFGASAVLSTETATTDANGEASVTAVANGIQGSFNVIAGSASASASVPAVFQLINLPSEKEKVVISQVSRGNASGAAYGHSFIELFNAGSEPVDLSGGWQVRYWRTLSSNPSWNTMTLSGGVLEPGQFHLVRIGGATGGQGAQPLPTPDTTANNTDNILPNGKVLLLRPGAAVGSEACPSVERIADLVGYGSLPEPCAWIAPISALSSVTVAEHRLDQYCRRSGDNSADFESAPPQPRNSASPFSPCPDGFELNIAAIGGGGQTTGIQQPFLEPLRVRVIDDDGEPVAGETVTFVVPSSGASAAPAAVTVTTDGSGEAQTTIWANAELGEYHLRAFTARSGPPVLFPLENAVPTEHIVTVSVEGEGSVSGDGIDCPAQSCLAFHAIGAEITLTATPLGDAVFVGWSGDCSGIGHCQLTMDADRQATAVFSRAPTIAVDQPVVVGSVGDPSNPTALVTVFDPDGSVEDLSVTVESSNETVLPAANVSVDGDGDGEQRTVTFAPAGRGVATVTFIVTNAHGLSDAVTMTYAASNQAPDLSGRYHHHISDASAALDVGDGYMILVDDETNTFFLHHQEISGLPVKTWTFTSQQLGTGSEIDFESIARLDDLVVFSGSHGNNRSGAARPERRTFVGATITGSGADTELTFLGRYNGLWADLRAWDADDGHGLGPNALGFVAGTAPGVQPNPPNGFNIEAMEFAPDGAGLYLGFRAPTIAIEGAYHALIVSVLNVDDIVDGAPASGPALFGDPILLDLDGRSIRELRRNEHNEYLISAGPSPQNETWALYTWNGDPEQAARFNRLLPDPDFLTGGVWEGIPYVPHPLVGGAELRIVTDSGDTNFYGTGQTKDLPLPYRKSYSQLFALSLLYDLTVAIEGGQGTVTGAGITCPGVCEESYAEGTEVTLTATPDPGFVFAGWGGDCAGTGACVATLDADRAVSAAFIVAASIVVDPDSLAAELTTGQADTRLVTITNTGEETLIWEVTEENGCALPPWLVADPAAGSVPGDDNQPVNVTLDAVGLAPDDYETDLCLASNDPGQPLLIVPVHLTVTELPALEVIPDALDFGPTEVGATGGLTMMLSSTGGAPVMITDISAPAAPFVRTGGDCPTTPFALDPAQSCTVEYNFTPPAEGLFNATVAIIADIDPAVTWVTLEGEGVITPPLPDEVFRDRFQGQP